MEFYSAVYYFFRGVAKRIQRFVWNSAEGDGGGGRVDAGGNSKGVGGFFVGYPREFSGDRGGGVTQEDEGELSTGENEFLTGASEVGREQANQSERGVVKLGNPGGW